MHFTRIVLLTLRLYYAQNILFNGGENIFWE